MKSIKEYIKEQNISAYSLSKSSGIAYSTVNYIVNGRTPIEKCELGTFVKLSEAMGLSVSDACRMFLYINPFPLMLHSDEYEVDGLISSKNGRLIVECDYDGKRLRKELVEAKYIYPGFEEDYGTMSLDNMITEYMIGEEP